MIAAYDFNTNLRTGQLSRSNVFHGMPHVEVANWSSDTRRRRRRRRTGPRRRAAEALRLQIRQRLLLDVRSRKIQVGAARRPVVQIASIDLDKQTASLIIGGKTSNALKAVRALNANTFIEVANEGFLYLTTIYDRDPTTGNYPAVHSRHFGLFGQPMFAQYEGHCTAKPNS